MESKIGDRSTAACPEDGGLGKAKAGEALTGNDPHENRMNLIFKYADNSAAVKVQFDALIPWLDTNRTGLNILIHAQTGNNLEDHTGVNAVRDVTLTMGASPSRKSHDCCSSVGRKGRRPSVRAF